MNTIINLSELIKITFQIFWELTKAFMPIIIPALCWLIAKLFVTRGVKWFSTVLGDRKIETRRKIRIAQDTVDLVSNVSDLCNKK